MINAGGSSGIGLATAKFLRSKGADVIILDVSPPSEELPGTLFHRCDVSKWEDLRESFYDFAGEDIDYVFANAGILEKTPYFTEEFDEQGRLLEPEYAIIDINVKGVYNVVKLAWSIMKRRREREEKSGQEKSPGSIVITTSSSGYAPEQAYPMYSSGKTAVCSYFLFSFPFSLPHKLKNRQLRKERRNIY
jgi:NAD(P)-dependent dehydrogenase (short-subunit alcohol dehydrogenase family)